VRKSRASSYCSGVAFTPVVRAIQTQQALLKELAAEDDRETKLN